MGERDWWWARRKVRALLRQAMTDLAIEHEAAAAELRRYIR